MPQPAVHLILAGAALARWSGRSATPFDVTSPAEANAFLAGSLAPDMGLFPGGAAEFSRCSHLRRTGDLTRALLRHAGTPVQRAFAWGWLSHVLADVAIHPLVNRAAAARGRYTLAAHVRVEVGLDVWLASRHGTLAAVALTPALRRADTRFISDAFAEVCGYRPGAGALLQMQRRMLHFTRLCVHFATRVAPVLCWNEPTEGAPPPLVSALAWHLITALSAQHTTPYAYMNPELPGAALLADVEAAMVHVHAQLDGYCAEGLDGLPDYNLQTGEAIRSARRVA